MSAAEDEKEDLEPGEAPVEPTAEKPATKKPAARKTAAAKADELPAQGEEPATKAEEPAVKAEQSAAKGEEPVGRPAKAKPAKTKAVKAKAAKADGAGEEQASAEKPAGKEKPAAKEEQPVAEPKAVARRAKPAQRRAAVSARARYVRTSARKARMVCGHLRGKSVQEARAILAFTPRDAARDWSKLLESAVANAENNHELLEDDLVVREAYADEGPTIKRFRPRAMGRATPIRKRTSHLTITLTPRS
jgi:ribosomal protein L22